MTSHEYPVVAAERKTNQCQHLRRVNPPSIRLLLVFLSERWSKPWSFMDNSALRPPITTRGLPLSNVTGSLCNLMSPIQHKNHQRVARCVTLASPISRHCISSMCPLALFSLLSRRRPGG